MTRRSVSFDFYSPKHNSTNSSLAKSKTEKTEFYIYFKIQNKGGVITCQCTLNQVFLTAYIVAVSDFLIDDFQS